MDLALVLVILLNFLVLGSSRLSACIRAVALEGVILAALPLAMPLAEPTPRLIMLSLGTLALKGVLFPWLLFRTIREATMRREVEPLIGFTVSLVLGAAGVLMAFLLASKLPLPPAVASTLQVPAALATLLAGLLVLVSRTKAIAQVLGYLLVENGIFIFGLSLVRDMPLLMELGVLLDLFVAVFVMGIVVHHISREFDHIDTRELTALKD